MAQPDIYKSQDVQSLFRPIMAGNFTAKLPHLCQVQCWSAQEPKPQKTANPSSQFHPQRDTLNVLNKKNSVHITALRTTGWLLFLKLTPNLWQTIQRSGYIQSAATFKLLRSWWISCQRGSLHKIGAAPLKASELTPSSNIETTNAEPRLGYLDVAINSNQNLTQVNNSQSNQSAQKKRNQSVTRSSPTPRQQPPTSPLFSNENRNYLLCLGGETPRRPWNARLGTSNAFGRARASNLYSLHQWCYQ